MSLNILLHYLPQRNSALDHIGVATINPQKTKIYAWKNQLFNKLVAGWLTSTLIKRLQLY